MLSLTEATRALRAAGEPTRLRLLALCALREWSVTELADSIGQSEPRVSRHLRILCEAGLLRRARRGPWVCYAAAGEGDAAALVALLLARIDNADAVRRRDAQRAASSTRALRPMAPRASKLGRAVAGFLHDSAPPVLADRLLLLEPMHLELIDAAAGIARRLTVVASRAGSREALRDHCDGRGIECELRARLGTDVYGWGAAIIDFTGEAGSTAVEPTLREVRARLALPAPLWVVLPYEFLEYARGNVVAHPITELRRMLAAAGFTTDRLKPIDEEAHVLVAHARLRESTESAA